MMKSIRRWPSGWVGILKCVPFKLSDSIPLGVNFGGLSSYIVSYVLALNGPLQGGVSINLFLNRIPNLKKNLNVVSLFIDLSFLFVLLVNPWLSLMYSISLNEYYRFCKKKI